MADGTLRLSIDIEPANANEAFQLFGSPDVPMAIARLSSESFIQHAQDLTIENNSERLTGMALQAVLWCKEPQFWDFINCEYATDDNIQSEMAASEWIKSVCEVESRKEINTNQMANQLFMEDIFFPYTQWKQDSEAV